MPLAVRYTRTHDAHRTHQTTTERTPESSRTGRTTDTGDESIERGRTRNSKGGEPQSEVLSSDKGEDGSCPESTETAGEKGSMKATQDDALSLLGKYEKERTSVLAVFVAPSRSVARVTGAIRVTVDGCGPHLVVGKDDGEADQIKFRLSDCVFEYGDFRDEESADKYEGFLVVASSKGIRCPYSSRRAVLKLIASSRLRPASVQTR
jgi:hypothetical protein